MKLELILALVIEFKELEEAWYLANNCVSFGVSAYTIRGRNF
jgi:hypothetical protein